MIIFGHNSLISPLMQYIHKIVPNQEIVIVTDKFDSNPYDNIHYVQGDPKDEKTIFQTNVQKAKMAIILADDRVNNPDAYTLVVANEVEKIHKDIITIGELTDARFKDLFKEANLDAFISEESLIRGISHDQEIGRIIKASLQKESK